MREALAPSVKVVAQALREILDQAPPELLSDLLDSGLALTGGGSLLRGLPDRLSDEFHVRVWLADDPLTCVVRGAAAILENLEADRQFLAPLERPRGTR